MKPGVVHLQSLFWPVLFFVAGITGAYYDLVSVITALGLAILIITSFIIWEIVSSGRKSLRTPYLFSLLLYFITAWLLTSYQATEFQKYAQKLSESNTVKGSISSVTHYHKMDRIQVHISPHHWWSPSHYFNINLLDKFHNLHENQIISINKSPSRIVSSANPFTFQARAYWEQKNTSHEVFLRDAAAIQILRENPKTKFQQFRQNALNRINSLYTNNKHRGLLKALLLGQKEEVSKEIKDDFKKAGLMHILAVSGLHVGIITVLILLLLTPLRLFLNQSWLHLILVTSLLWIYAALTGMNTPVVRAVILVSFYLIGENIDQQIDKWNIYFWAILLVLVIQPTTLFMVSFQLSFGAVAAILLFYKKFYAWTKPILGSNYFTGLTAVSLAAQVGVLPILLYHFNEISLVSTVSGFLVIPLLFPLILASSLSLIIPQSWQWLSNALVGISKTITDLISGISDMLANWDISSFIWVCSTTTFLLIITAIMLSGLHLELKTKLNTKAVLYGAIGFLLLSVVSETLNIYLYRKKPVIAIYGTIGVPVTDLYYRGICYTNTPNPSPAFIIKNRKKHYTVKTDLISNDISWQSLLSEIYDFSATGKYELNSGIKVLTYGSYPFDLTDETTQWPTDDSNPLRVVLPAPPQNPR